jgi:hypothetical protein
MLCEAINIPRITLKEKPGGKFAIERSLGALNFLVKIRRHRGNIIGLVN